MEPKILLVGKIGPIMAILRDELNNNFSRDVISASTKEEVEKIVASEAIDLVILGAGFDDATRDDVALAIASIKPDIEPFFVPRVGDKSPYKLIELTNSKAIEWKFMKVMGGKPGGRMGPPTD